MKKLFAILFLAGALSGCGFNEADPDTGKTPIDVGMEKFFHDLTEVDSIPDLIFTIFGAVGAAVSAKAALALKKKPAPVVVTAPAPAAPPPA